MGGGDGRGDNAAGEQYGDLGQAGTTDTVALIQTAIQGALDASSGGDIITVDGTYVNNTLVSTTGTLTLSIPRNVTLRWQAVYEGTVNTADMITFDGYSEGTLDVAVGGSIVNNESGRVIDASSAPNLTINVSGGTVRRNSTASGDFAIGGNNINVSGGTVSATGGRAIRIDSGGTGLTVSGGTVSAVNSAYAITGDGNVTVSNGTVSATTGVAIYKATGSSSVTISGGTTGNAIQLLSSATGTVTVSGGFVFAYGTAIDGTGDVISIGGGTLSVNPTAGNNGVVAAWDNSGGTTYNEGASDDLIANPAGAVVWQSGGIRYTNGTNTGSFPLSGVTVTDVTPPTLTLVSVSRASDADVTVKYATNEAGTYYIQLDGTAPADAAALVTDRESGTPSATGASGPLPVGERSLTYYGITPTTHTLYIAAKDAAGNVSTLLTVNIPAYTPPILTAGTVSRTSETAATVKFTSDEAGHYYYEVVESGAAAPSIDTSGTGTSCNTQEQTIAPVLSGNSAKDIYIVVKDAAGNVSANTFKIAIPAYVPLSSAKAITAFTLAGAAGTINESAGTIAVTVPYGTDLTNIAPTITHTGTNINPALGAVQNFTNPVNYTVTAEDSTTKVYLVTVTVAPMAVDKTALSAALASANAIAHGGVNTTQAWTDFENAKTAAANILNQTSPPAIQAEIDTATANLNAAITALKAYDDSFGFENGTDRYTQGSGVNLVHIAARDWSLHTGIVYVDGQRLTHGTHHLSAVGSTRTALLASYLDTLSVGQHTLTIEFSSGIAPIVDTFEVLAAVTTPATGDNSNLTLLWVSIICAALGMLCLIVWRKRQRETVVK